MAKINFYNKDVLTKKQVASLNAYKKDIQSGIDQLPENESHKTLGNERLNKYKKGIEGKLNTLKKSITQSGKQTTPTITKINFNVTLGSAVPTKKTVNVTISHNHKEKIIPIEFDFKDPLTTAKNITQKFISVL